jgi:16S rRNA (cytidine1402-2'-O)-methyltransferase
MADGRKRGRYAIEGQVFDASPPAPGLYVVATPIGHLGDVSIRALATLAGADLVACEDTRITARLLQRYGIEVPLIAYHEHNAAKQRPTLLAALGEGKSVALVSDAGTPLVSDPGFRLVEEVLEAGHAVVPIPGASAMLAALVVSGLPTDSFFFAGFLPPKSAARKKRLASLATVPGTLVFYESPHRTAAALAEMAEVLGADREAAVARELTKIHETIRRGRLGALAAAFAAEAEPKGEIVILVGPPGEAAAPTEAEIDESLAALLDSMPASEAAATLAAHTGLPRKDLYRRVLALKKGKAG